MHDLASGPFDADIGLEELRLELLLIQVLHEEAERLIAEHTPPEGTGPEPEGHDL